MESGKASGRGGRSRLKMGQLESHNLVLVGTVLSAVAIIDWENLPAKSSFLVASYDVEEEEHKLCLSVFCLSVIIKCLFLFLY